MNAKYDSVMPGSQDLKGGEVDLHTYPHPIDAGLIRDINLRLTEYRELMDSTKLRAGMATMMLISARGNQYLQDSGLDNTLFSSQPERCAQVILNAINLIYVLSVLVHPFMPTTSTQILEQLNAPARSLPSAFSIDILPGHTLGKAEHLFKKIENLNGSQEKAWQTQFGGDPIVAQKVTPVGPNGHAEGGKVPHMKDTAKKAVADGSAASSRQKKKLAEANETEEERDLKAKIEAQGLILKDLKLGKQDGDIEKEMSTAKDLKVQLADLKKRLKADGTQD